MTTPKKVNAIQKQSFDYTLHGKSATKNSFQPRKSAQQTVMSTAMSVRASAMKTSNMHTSNMQKSSLSFGEPAYQPKTLVSKV